MTLTPTDDRITSDETAHFASRTNDGWTVSWWPGRTLDRNAATTAMTIAEMIADPEPYGKKYEALLSTFAKELGLTGAEAVELVLVPLGEVVSEAWTFLELEAAINDPKDLHYLPEHVIRLAMTKQLAMVPVEVAASINQARKLAQAGELHDTHAVGDEADDRRPLVIPEAGVEVLIDSDGGVWAKRPTGFFVPINCDASPGTADEINDAYGPLTHARIVPADTIVLELPDDEITANLREFLGSSGKVAYAEKGGVIFEGYDAGDDEVFFRFTTLRARALAAHLALAADDAERGQG